MHGTLIWRGDILAMYALAAFALVMFRTATPRRLLVAALLLWFFGPLLVREAMQFAGLRVMLPGNSGETVPVYAHGSWWAIEQARVRGFLQWFGRWGLTTYAYVLAAFLLGLWTVKTGWLRRLLGEQRLTRRVLLVALILGLIGYARWAWGDALWPRAQAPASLLPAFPYPYFQREMLGQAWWLARHEYGPMERLWRRLTYGPGYSGAALSSPLGPAAA